MAALSLVFITSLLYSPFRVPILFKFQLYPWALLCHKMGLKLIEIIYQIFNKSTQLFYLFFKFIFIKKNKNELNRINSNVRICEKINECTK